MYLAHVPVYSAGGLHNTYAPSQPRGSRSDQPKLRDYPPLAAIRSRRPVGDVGENHASPERPTGTLLQLGKRQLFFRRLRDSLVEQLLRVRLV